MSDIWVKKIAEDVIGGSPLEKGKRYLHPEDGLIEAKPGKTIDYGWVAQKIAAIVGEWDVRAIAFDRWRIDVGGQASPAAPALLADLHRRFNSPEFVAFARALTGDDRIAYVDAQATRFLPGHFLNRHSDQLDRAGRLYAYVLNLCPRWRVEWGGLLQFLDDEGDVTETLTPGFNTLNLFRVPQPHAVSMVSPFAGAPRLSITGWWRAFPPEPVT